MKYIVNLETKTIGIFPKVDQKVHDVFDALEGLKKMYPDFSNWTIRFATDEEQIEQKPIDLGLTMPDITPKN